MGTTRIWHLGLTGMHDTGGDPVRALSRIEALERHVHRGRGYNDRRESCESGSPAPGTPGNGQRSRRGHPDEGVIGRIGEASQGCVERRRRRRRHRSVDRMVHPGYVLNDAVEPPSLGWVPAADLIDRDFDG